MKQESGSEGRVALVTGANRGIGREVVRQLARRGMRVVLTARDRLAGQHAAGEAGHNPGTIEFVAMDVADARSVRMAADEVTNRIGRLDILVNNAGILIDHDTSVTELSEDALRATLDVNLFGPLRVVQAFLPLLAKSPAGRIVNISSGAGALHDMEHWSPAYSISKTALNALTRQFAAALKEHGIAVNSVCPGWVRTDMGGPDATLSIEEGADTAVWLATDAPRKLTGQFIRKRKSIAW